MATDQLTLTTVTPLRTWNSTDFDVYQGRTDYADFRFTLANGSKRSVLRLLANKDVRIYGEVILDNGAFRSASGFSFTSGDASVVASFRTKDTNGGPVGTEVAQIDVAGNFTATGFVTGLIVTATYISGGLFTPPTGGRPGEILIDTVAGIWVNNGTSWARIT